MKPTCFFWVILGGWFVSACSASDAEPERPNILFILADDLGWRDLSVQGSRFYESPHIDRIAREGMRFQQGYATCQVCSPSRASIMTGKYPARLAITDWIGAAEGFQWKRNTRLLPAHYNHSLPKEEFTLAEAFKEAGYRTFFTGEVRSTLNRWVGVVAFWAFCWYLRHSASVVCNGACTM